MCVILTNTSGSNGFFHNVIKSHFLMIKSYLTTVKIRRDFSTKHNSPILTSLGSDVRFYGEIKREKKTYCAAVIETSA